MKKVSIINYGLGNLFSIQNACSNVGINSIITNDKKIINKSDAIILPGVGAFEHAMVSLEKLNLIDSIISFAKSERPLIGICLGMQLLFEKSYEFGLHHGLGLIPGNVIKLDVNYPYTVPHVQWNRLNFNNEKKHLIFKGINESQYFYFVHSFICKPTNNLEIATTTNYDSIDFCSSVINKNIYGFQFHPERSAEAGLIIYKNLKKII